MATKSRMVTSTATRMGTKTRTVTMAMGTIVPSAKTPATTTTMATSTATPTSMVMHTSMDTVTPQTACRAPTVTITWKAKRQRMRDIKSVLASHLSSTSAAALSTHTA